MRPAFLYPERHIVAKDNELIRLRAEARKRRAAATAKIGRIRRSTGVELNNTNYDPRRSLDAISKYNKTQLRNYINEVNNFTSRTVNFVPGVGGAPLPKSEWVVYKRLESRFNVRGDSEFEKIAETFLPQSGMTIRQRKATILPDRMRAQGDVTNSFYPQIVNDSTNIKNRESLAKLINSLEKKLNVKYLPGKIKAARGQLNDMFDVIGNADYKRELANLTDHQFNILWNTDFATRVSMLYEFMKMRAAGAKGMKIESMENETNGAIREFINWAASQPKAPTKK